MTAPVGWTRRHRRPPRPAVGLVVALLLLLGCTETDEEPPSAQEPPPAEDTEAPPPGRDVVVVLPAATELEAAVLDGLATRLAGIEDDLPDLVRELRIRRPDGPPFVGDLLELAAARQAQLACVLGPGTGTLADTVALRHGATTVCTLPAQPAAPAQEGDAEPSALRVQAPVFELGVLVGTAARTAALARVVVPDDGPTGDAPDDGQEPGEGEGPGAGDAAEDGDGAQDGDAPADGDPAQDVGPRPAPPVVGLVLGGDVLDPEAFRAGLLEGLGRVEAIEVAVSGADPVDAVAAVRAAGAEVIVFDGALGVAAALADLPPSVGVLAPVDLVPVDLAPGEDGTDGPSNVVASYRLRWEDLVAEVIDRVVTGEPPAVVEGGVEGLLEIRPGSAIPGLEAVLERVRRELFPPLEGDAATAPPAGESRDAGP